MAKEPDQVEDTRTHQIVTGADHVKIWYDEKGNRHESLVDDDQVQAAASSLGTAGGQSTSNAKAAAARENGKRGGRPPST
jgi:hypothetical protein